MRKTSADLIEHFYVKFYAELWRAMYVKLAETAKSRTVE